MSRSDKPFVRPDHTLPDRILNQFLPPQPFGQQEYCPPKTLHATPQDYAAVFQQIVLTLIIIEEENRVQTMLPVSFLRQLISLYGVSMQSMVPQYLEASMDAFRRNQTQFRQAMEGAFAGGPFAEIAKRNMDMFEAAASAFKPQRPDAPAKDAPAAAAAETPPRSEVEALKAQLAAMQEQINKLK